MAVASPSINVIRAQIRAIRDKAPNAQVFGIFTPGRWTGPSLDGSGSDKIAVYQCDSLLQMRLAMQEAPESAAATVIVTPLDQSKVSDDILVRLAMRKLYPINSWEIVRSLFKAKQLDPRITRHAFLADLLLEHAAKHEVSPVAGGLLDADTVWDILLTERLGLSGAHPDVVEILRCSAESDTASRWRILPAEFRSVAADWIAETAGDVAKTVLGCLTSEHGEKALAIGLVLGVIYDSSVGHDLDKAAGRLEAFMGTTYLPTDFAHRWRDAAIAAASLLKRETHRRCLEQAEIILDNIGAAPHAWRSDALESGFEQRLSKLGQALKAHIDSRATMISEELQNIYDSILQHRLGSGGGRRMERIAMAIRLARRLADQNGATTQKATSLSAIAKGYASDSGYVDWARQVLRGGEANKDLSSAFARLVERLTEVREEENLRFGKALLEQQGAADTDSGLIPVEQIIEKVVSQAVKKAPVLLLLVDGMNWSVFRELMCDLISRDWIDLGMHPSPERLIGLAALPSITEVCRASLLCGQLRRGYASDEVQGFSTNPHLVAASQPGLAPKLFHKAALEGDEDSSLAGDIRQALANKKQRVVGIVINAVDDHLDKGDQIDVQWTVQHIRVLDPILSEAGASGRLVVLLSDHGHILDRHTEHHEATDGLRWRRPGEAATREELDVRSSRVVVPDGGRVIVPWSERIRYGAKKNGYHGGATPQEMLIPIGILWNKRQAPSGFRELPAELPTWWTEPTVSGIIPVVPPAETHSKRKSASPQPAVTQLDLFAPPTVTPPEPVDQEPWISALFQSEVFIEQKKRSGGRVPISDTKVRYLLSALVSRGGSMTTAALAGAIGEPEHRLPGFLSVMQRLLNVEGYPILDRQDAANTVVLNVALLKKQFELDM